MSATPSPGLIDGMRRLLLTLILAAVFLGGCSSDDTALPDLKGSYRVIAIFSPSADRAQSSVNAMKSTPGVKDRSIAWFVVGPDTIVSNIDDKPDRKQLEELHNVDAFEAVLVGKNGKVEATQLGGLNLQEIFDAIDGTPLQQQAKQQQ